MDNVPNLDAPARDTLTTEISSEVRVTAADIDAAAARLSGVVVTTPLEFSERLSTLTGARVYLKREDQQVVRSFKLRGAYNAISQLNETEAAAGVVCASAGNHAQGVAYACRTLGIHGRIYLPRTTPRQKRDRIRFHGAEFVKLVLVGETYDDAAAAATADVERTGATMIAPFNNLQVIAGGGTVAREIVNQLGHVPDVVVIPVGGGGLLAGMSSFLNERFPHVALYGVEPAGAPSMQAALNAGTPVKLGHIDPFVDGASVARVGDYTHALMSKIPVTMLTVSEGRICTDMLALYQNEGIIAEPAGAMTVAAVTVTLGEESVPITPGSTVVCVVSGGNNDVSRYGEILERSLVQQGLKHYFLVNFPQEPGALRKFLDEVLGPDDDISLFEYVKRNNRETGPALVGIELGSADTLPDLLARMESASLEIEQIDPHSPTFRFLT